MPLVAVPLVAHSSPCHTCSPNFQIKSPLYRHKTHVRARYIARLSDLRDGQISRQAALDLQFPDDDQGPAKFQPFVARNELRRRMLGYYRELPTRAGDQILVIQPVSEEWIEPTADLLTEAFADSMGYVMYRNFLRRQIRNYLRSHMKLPPKTVCLVGLLVSKEVLENQSKNDEASGVYSDSQRTSGASDDGSGSGGDVADGMLGDGMGNNFWPASTNNGTAGSLSEESDGERGAMRRKLNPSVAKVVGAVEVSFTESTRSKEWTGLNPPPERPYLCNMAVAGQVRRQGIGGLILEAAEDLVQCVGEDQLYLHLRFKDAPAAALYRKAGYTSTAQDSIFVRLVGQDRRWLMKKILKEE